MDKIDTSEQKKSTSMPISEKVKGGRRGPRPPMRGRRAEKPAEEFEQRIVDLARVTRVMAGGKRMKFRACMVIGDKNGRVSMGLAKGADVSMAIAKSVTQAKKHWQNVPIIDGTIPHQVTVKLKSAKIMIKPAKKGSGIKAGGVVRTVLELAGIKDISAKILGANNKINNARATLLALDSFVPRSFPKTSTIAKAAKPENKPAQPIHHKEHDKTPVNNKK
ncbi:MAG: 30S ribosomal protein S5 [Patescibacteria group bacterium]